MGSGNLGAAARVIALTALAVAIWALAKYGYAKPQVLDETAPAAVFSAGRADATLARLLGPEKPHPVSSDENAAVRARVIAAFAKLGVKTSTYTAFACNPWRGFQVVPCATVTDILAEVVPGEGKAIVLLAHYDSVPAGPGASDDESGTAIVLETARALRARGAKSKHPVLAVITDGEEAGLLGAQAFLQNPALKARVGVVVNVEARGTRGRSLLFQTSPAESRLIDLYVKSLPYYATSSLFAEIYKLLPNDTDLTLFLHQGFTGFNFAFSDNVADYHTPLDTRANLSKLTLQQQGENMLGVASALAQTDYDDLAGHNEVYLDLFGFVVPRMPAMWALPVALVSLLMLLFAAWRASGIGRGAWLRAALMPPAVLVAAAIAGWLLHMLAQLISGQPDPSYAYPIALREGLAFGVVAAMLLAARLADGRAATLSVWIWFAALAVATAAFLPGISPYFLFPALAAALIALLLVIVPKVWLGDILFAIPILIALAIWLSLVAAGEGLMGLKLHPLFTIPAGFAAMTMVPLIHAPAMRRAVWLGLIAVAVGGALVATIIAGFQPAYSKTMAQRLSIRYVEDGGQAKWALDANAPLPAPLREAAAFSKEPEPILPDTPFALTYNAPAGKAQFAPPTAEIVADGGFAGGRRVTVALHGSPQAADMLIFVPKAAKLKAIDIHGQHIAPPAGYDNDTLISCVSRDCAQEVVSIETATHAGFTLRFGERRPGLPPASAKIVAARPPQAIPSQTGDTTLLASKLDIPAR
ncbi:MAG TPA: M20/M25/M40 family metallo-hydrolase [Rhizomicrobium sp.]|nr:M20/M25/M40 family metallo-hydrolase [Rhizomicrobium sp.]